MFSRLGSRIAAVHASLVAGLAIAGSLLFLLSAERSLDSEMTARARAIARMAALGLEPRWIPALEQSSLPVRSLADSALLRSAEASGSRRIVVLGADGRVLATSDPRIPHGERFAGLAVDSFEVARVKAGAVTASRPYQGEGGVWYQSAWISVPGAPTALLGTEIAVSWRAPLERLRRAVGVFAIGGVLASAAIGVLLARSVTRPLARLADAMSTPGPDGLPGPAGVRGSDEVGALGTQFDRLVEALRQHDAELRALSATVAHEVRNPLGAMSGFAELIARRSQDPEILEMTGGIREEVAALERLVVRFLSFARDLQLLRRPTELGTLLEDALRAGLPAGSRVTVKRGFDSPGPTVDCDPDALREVFINLLRNGAQATHETGNLSVRVSNDSSGVEVSIEDDGPGIAPEIRERLFQPFATTKPDGTGLGLAICKRIVSGHGGTLSFESAASGTRFLVRIPKKCAA